MISSDKIDIPEIAAMAAAGVSVRATGGEQAGTVLGGLAGVSPALAAGYLGYLVVRTLIPAVLIVATIDGVPAKQRSALLQSYLCGATDRPQQAITRPLAATEDPAAAAPAQAGGDHVPGAGDDE